VTEAPAPPAPYRVVYSERVRNELKGLRARAKERGLGPNVRAAVQEIHQRLQIYPQLGQPLRTLKLEPAQLWVGVVPPLVVQYFLDEDRRLVMVVVPFSPRPNSGL
jgi:hypothetical protein